LEQIAAEHGCLDHETNTSETPIKLGFETSIIAASLMEDSKRCLQSTKRASLYRTTETCCNGSTWRRDTTVIRSPNERRTGGFAATERRTKHSCSQVQCCGYEWTSTETSMDFNGLQRSWS
jgi:hypothetical protein